MVQWTFDGCDMNGVKHIDPIILANDHDNIFAHRSEFRVRHGKFPAIGQMNDEWFEPIRDPIPNMLNIHKYTI